MLIYGHLYKFFIDLFGESPNDKTNNLVNLLVNPASPLGRLSIIKNDLCD